MVELGQEFRLALAFVGRAFEPCCEFITAAAAESFLEALPG